MKVVVLDEVIKRLSDLETTNLYGKRQEDCVLVLSLDKSSPFELVGRFRKDGFDCELDHDIKDKVLCWFKNNKAEFCYMSNDQVQEVELELLNFKTDMVKRIAGLVDDTVMKGKSVAIIGGGSVGSEMAVQFARSGINKVTLIDMDEVDIKNLCRTTFDMLDIGRKKVHALKDKLLRINPFIEVNAIDMDVLQMDREILSKIIDSVDLIVEATDNIKCKLLINARAKDRAAIIYPSVYNMGKGGDIYLSLPGLPDFEEVFHSILPEMYQHRAREWEYSTGQTKPMPSLGSDIQVIIARAVKISIAILTAEQENSIFDKVMIPGCTLLVISNEKDGVPYIDHPFGEHWLNTEPDMPDSDGLTPNVS